MGEPKHSLGWSPFTNGTNSERIIRTGLQIQVFKAKGGRENLRYLSGHREGTRLSTN